MWLTLAGIGWPRLARSLKTRYGVTPANPSQSGLEVLAQVSLRQLQSAWVRQILTGVLSSCTPQAPQEWLYHYLLWYQVFDWLHIDLPPTCRCVTVTSVAHALPLYHIIFCKFLHPYPRLLPVKFIVAKLCSIPKISYWHRSNGTEKPPPID